MRVNIKPGFASIVILCLLLATSAQALVCLPSARWAVKTLKDPDAKKIDFKPKITTIRSLVNIKTGIYPYPLESGRQGHEFNTYQVVCRIKSYSIAEEDGDLNLVISDPKYSQYTLIAEVPNPDCPNVKDSPYAREFRRVWDEFRESGTRDGKIIQDGKRHGTRRGLYRLTGVAFVDIPHFQEGRAKNNIELHPVIIIKKLK